MSSARPNIRWLWLAALAFALDQASKFWIERLVSEYHSIPVLPVLNITHLHNTGVAFSMFTTAPALVFVLLSVAVSLAIFVWLLRSPPGQSRIAAALSLILAGALGNALDRLTRGYVVDFIDFHLRDWHFAAFNIADSAITIGAGLLILDSLLDSLGNRRPPAQAGS